LSLFLDVCKIGLPALATVNALFLHCRYKGRKMNLQLVNVWTKRPHVGFSDLWELAAQCRDGACASGRESAALVLLAEKAGAFGERYEGTAVSTEVVDEFLAKLRQEARVLQEASQSSDAAYLDALNSFAAKSAQELLV
jgi:hypothetical protein